MRTSLFFRTVLASAAVAAALPMEAQTFPPPVLLQNLAPKTSQEVVMVIHMVCPPKAACTVVSTPADADVLLTGMTEGIATSSNRYDEKGNLYFRHLRTLTMTPAYSATNEMWIMDPTGKATKFADMQVGQISCVQTSPTTSEQVWVDFIGFAYNPAPQIKALYVVTKNTVTTYSSVACQSPYYSSISSFGLVRVNPFGAQ